MAEVIGEFSLTGQLGLDLVNGKLNEDCARIIMVYAPSAPHEVSEIYALRWWGDGANNIVCVSKYDRSRTGSLRE